MHRPPPQPPQPAQDDSEKFDTPVAGKRITVFKGRGAITTPDGRFESMQREAFDDGWGNEQSKEEAPATIATTLFLDSAKTVITENKSPDVPFDLSINPYRGCEHGCVYCFARPTHSYLGLSPGLDFETKIGYKADAASLLRKELARKSYRCRPIALGINTDGWQPIERKLGLTRAILEVLAECRHPTTIVTKGAVIERDIDLLVDMARDNLVEVIFSVTTLDPKLARAMEPRAASPQKRLELMKHLSDKGIPTGVLFAPLIPALNDHELESVFEAASDAGAETASYTILRLPHELADIFPAWLENHAPDRASHVMSLIRQMRNGKSNDAAFGSRMTGKGLFAQIYSRRARLAIERLGLNRVQRTLDTTKFRPPKEDKPQLSLW